MCWDDFSVAKYTDQLDPLTPNRWDLMVRWQRQCRVDGTQWGHALDIMVGLTRAT